MLNINKINNTDKMNILKKSQLLLYFAFLIAHLSAQTYFNQAQKYHLEQDYSTAIKYLNQDLQLNPRHSDAYMLRASCNYHCELYNNALSDVNEAIKYFNKKTSIYDESQLYAERGDIYYAIEDYKKAITNYSIAIKKDAKTVDYLRCRALCYAALKEYDKSDDDYNKALKIDNTYIVARLGLVDNLIAQSKHNDAMNLLNQLEKIDSRNALIYWKRCLLYWLNNNYKKAIDNIVTYMYYDEVNFSGRQWLLYLSQFNFDYSVAKIKAKILVDTEQKISWMHLLAGVYEANKRYLMAIQIYNDIEREVGENAILCYHRGENFDQIGFYDLAISEYNAGIKLDPDAEYLYLERAASYNAQRKFDEAITDINRAIQLKPMDVRAYFSLAWSKWLYKKDYPGAIEDISLVITMQDEYQSAHLMRGRIYQKIGKNPLAEADFNKIVELNDTNTSLAYALIFLNKLKEARIIIDTLIERDSTDYYEYACLFSNLKEYQKAIHYLRKTFDDGWRDFVHIENDPDIDNIRNLTDFTNLIAEYKAKYAKELSDYEIQGKYGATTSASNTQIYIVPIKKLKSNLYEVICSVNGVPMKFLYDTGASGVLLSKTEADFLLKNDYLKSTDFGQKVRNRMANGSLVEGVTLRIRKFKIGDLELENIEGSVIDNSDVDLLLGQSVLQKFGKIEIDNEKSVMIITINR
jgi:clan AA aspartic protease (TIGR02281 family)